MELDADEHIDDTNQRFEGAIEALDFVLDTISGRQYRPFTGVH